jgi:transposase
LNRNTNDKINQVSEKTLVIGIDIAKRKHYAYAIDDRGRELAKAFPFNQSLSGFTGFYKRISDIKQTHGKTEIIVGFEPTGHYWMNLAAFLVNHGIRFVMVNPMHVNRTKELDDNLQTKNDKKDARVIAQLIRDGRYSYPRILEGVEAELRTGATLRSKLQEDITAIQNRMIRWVDRFFPEFGLVYKSFGKNACAVLEKTPLPIDLVGKNVEELVSLYRQVEGLKYPSRPKTKALLETAETSIGLTEGLDMARMEINMLVAQFRLLHQHLEVLTEKLIKWAKQLSDYDFILSIPGVGENTAVELLSEVGSFTHYNHPRQIIKLAGLTLRENSSGQHKGQKKISKRGRRKLRAVLFRVILPLIQHNTAFKSLYLHYTTRTVNPLKNKQAMVVLCGKLIKILHALCQKQVPFDPQVMMKDLYCLEETA